MSLVIAMYLLKVIVKLAVGAKIGSVSVYSDGLHNLSDIFEALLVIFALYLSRQPETAKYPVGKSSIESIGSLLIGIALLVVGIGFFLKSVLGLLVYFKVLPFLAGLLMKVIDAPTRIDLGASGGLVIGVIVGSILLSWVVSWYQVSTGRMKNHPSLVSDGKETFSDSLVEFAVLAGIIGAFFNLFYLDYVFGIIVAFMILRTSKEILTEAGENLLQKSIEQKDVVKIRNILSKTKGVEGYDAKGSDKVMAYKLGKFTFIFVKVYVSPSLTPEGFYWIKKGINARIRKTLPESEVRIYLRQSVLPEKPRRAIIPVCRTGKNPLHAFIEENFTKAKQFYIVDLKGERIVNVMEHENNFKKYSELAQFIKNKRADIIYLVKEDKRLAELLPKVKVEKTGFLIFQDLFH
jgi:cation diffusion facilitator family transporter